MSEQSVSAIRVIVLAAGSGRRYGQETPKQFVPLLVRSRRTTPLDLVLDAYQQEAAVNAITVVGSQNYLRQIQQFAALYPKVDRVVVGGATRQMSSMSAVESTTEPLVLIHDVTRPLVCQRAVRECCGLLRTGRALAVNTVLPVPCGLVAVKESEMIGAVQQEAVAYGQCPQGFVTSLLQTAQRRALRETETQFEDDCSLCRQLMGVKVLTVLGHPAGMQLTYPEDLELLRTYLLMPPANG